MSCEGEVAGGGSQMGAPGPGRPVRAGLLAPGWAVWRQPCPLGTGRERWAASAVPRCALGGEGATALGRPGSAGQQPLVESATFWGRASWLREPWPLSLARHPLCADLCECRVAEPLRNFGEVGHRCQVFQMF